MPLGTPMRTISLRLALSNFSSFTDSLNSSFREKRFERQSTTLTVCEIVVANAAAQTPQRKTPTNSRSSSTFMTDEHIR